MEKSDGIALELAFIIVNFGTGSKILKFAKQYGVKGGTIFLGMGTRKNRFLEMLELADVRREIVLIGGEKSVVDMAVAGIAVEFQFSKPYHGIAYTIPMMELIGISGHIHSDTTHGGDEIMYHSITVVVEKGKAELVMEAATKAGARGGTIVNARGGGSSEAIKLFQMDIEPEKEMVIILSEVSNTERTVNSICDSLEIGKPGNGVVFCQEVSATFGVYQ